MGAAYMLQNRKLPQQQGGARVVYAWPMDVIEAFCSSGDIAFTDTAHRVIVAGTERCALHCMADDPCPQGFRMPPECPHERLDPAADPERPRCSICGLTGEDQTARRLRKMTASPAIGPLEGDEAYTEEVIES